jgi:ABC-2 type transport system permease protein
MNTQSNATSPTFRAESVAPAEIPALRQFFSLIEREVWESRSLYIAPLATACVFLLGFVIKLASFRGHLRSASSPLLSPAELGSVTQPFDVVAVLMMVVTFLVALLYCLDALYGERRDRSILFWKSLPVSDTATVLSKASIPIVAVPLFAFALTIATQLVMFVLSSVVIQGSGITVEILWSQLSPFHQWHLLFVHLVIGHGLWYAPIYAYLLLISAWARRAPFLWATLPLVALSGAEKIAFYTSYVADILGNRIAGGPPVEGAKPGTMTMEAMTPFTFTQLMSSPGMWIGLLVAAVFLAGAIRLRRHRGPI